MLCYDQSAFKIKQKTVKRKIDFLIGRDKYEDVGDVKSMVKKEPRIFFVQEYLQSRNKNSCRTGEIY